MHQLEKVASKCSCAQWIVQPVGKCVEPANIPSWTIDDYTLQIHACDNNFVNRYIVLFLHLLYLPEMTYPKLFSSRILLGAIRASSMIILLSVLGHLRCNSEMLLVLLLSLSRPASTAPSSNKGVVNRRSTLVPIFLRVKPSILFLFNDSEVDLLAISPL